MRVWLAIVLLLAGCVSGPDQPPTQASAGDSWTELPPPGDGPIPLPERCLYQDCAHLWLNITVEAPGEFHVLVPAPESPPYTDLDAWARNATVTGATLAIAELDGSRYLALEGTHYALLRSHAFQPPTQRGNQCCAEDYMATLWNGQNANDGVPTRVGGPEDARLVVTYQGRSQWCEADQRFEGAGSGWITLARLPGGGGCA